MEEAELQWRHFSMNITFGHFPSLLLLASYTREESGAEVSQELISSLTRVKERTNERARIQRSAEVNAPGCVKAAGKLGQK